MFSEHQIVAKTYMIIAILTSGYALTTTRYSSSIYLLCALGVALFLIRTLRQDGRINSRKSRIALILLSITLTPALISLFANPNTENAVSLFKLALTMAFGSVIYITFEFQDFQKLFADAIFVICTISLPGYILANFTENLAALPIIHNVNDVGYKFAVFFISFDGFLQYRNIGVFWEPGIFASMIFCALIADLYSHRKIGAIRTIIFFTALTLTFSGAGLILFATYAILAIAHPSEKNTRSFSNRVLPALLIILIALISVLHTAQQSESDIFTHVERLASKLTDPEDTQSTRFLSPLVSFNVFLEKPLTGWGLAGAIEQYKLLNNEIALTSTSAHFISAIGVVGAFLTIIPIIGIIRTQQANFVSRLLLVFSYIFILNKEPHTYFTLTHALTFFLLSESLRPHNQFKTIKLAKDLPTATP